MPVQSSCTLDLQSESELANACVLNRERGLNDVQSLSSWADAHYRPLTSSEKASCRALSWTNLLRSVS